MPSWFEVIEIKVPADIVIKIIPKCIDGRLKDVLTVARWQVERNHRELAALVFEGGVYSTSRRKNPVSVKVEG